MKNFKIISASLIFVIVSIYVLSFTASSYDPKAFAVVCYLFTEDESNDRLIKGATDQIGYASFTDAENWNFLSGVSTPNATLCPAGECLCAVCFDNSQYTLAQALNIVFNAFNGLSTGQTFSHGQDVDPSANVIRIYKRIFDAQ